MVNKPTCSLLLLALIAATSCGINRDTAIPDDQSSIQGIWLAQTESVNGVKKNVNFQYIFSGDTLSFTDENGTETRYLFRLDTTSSPRYIVIRPVDSPANATPVSVGYELYGDSLNIVVAPPGLRPGEISDKNDQELIVCKRKGS